MSKAPSQIEAVTSNMDMALQRLLDSSPAQPTSYHDSMISAFSSGRNLWENELLAHQGKGKLHKLLKNYADLLDYQMKHSTGGTQKGYSLLMNCLRTYL